MLIQRNLLPTNPNKALNCNRFKNFVINSNNNFTSLIVFLQKQTLYINLNVFQEIVSVKIRVYTLV